MQTIYYGITIRAGDPKPQPGTPRWAEHRRRIHILVVAAYLLYTIYEADFELRRAGNFYADLGVPFAASERDVKARFRRLAAQFHPDKVASSSDASSDAASAYYVHLKTAADTLADPVRRFAYDRFGPSVNTWQHCASVLDYVVRGAQALLPDYGGAVLVIYALGLAGLLSWGQYWRWLAMAVLFVFEAHTITRPTHPAFLARVVNPLLESLGGGVHPPFLPFQAISLARQLSMTLAIALNQIGPLLAADTSSGRVVTGPTGGGGGAAGGDEAIVRRSLERLEAMVRSVDADSARLLEMEMAPYANDPDLLRSMRGKVKEWLVQNTIRADPMVRDALGRSIQRRRADAPAGARGNR